MEEDIYANDIPDKGLVSKIYKELKQLTTKKPKQFNQKMVKGPK